MKCGEVILKCGELILKCGEVIPSDPMMPAW